MSFADRVREELCELPVKPPCCRRAMLDALLLSALPTGEKKEFSVRLRHPSVATLASTLLRQQYGKEPTLIQSGASGHRYYDLVFSSPAVAKRIDRLQNAKTTDDEPLSFACDGCGDAFLRGCFLFYGTVNDPKTSFHLEMTAKTEAMASRLADVLADLGYPPRKIARATGVGLYYKNASAVEELITRMGAYHILFDVINSRIEREIRNNENRATNCVAKNIEKSISAAARQLEAIELLRTHGRLESLPLGVRATALLRCENPDATLDELRALHSPSISKSGLNHRLQRILEEAEEIKNKH